MQFAVVQSYLKDLSVKACKGPYSNLADSCTFARRQMGQGVEGEVHEYNHLTRNSDDAGKRHH